MKKILFVILILINFNIIINANAISTNIEKDNNTVNYLYKYNTKKIFDLSNIKQEQELDKKITIVEENLKQETIVKEKLSNKEIALDNCIKIVIIVLLGALIVYFINKNETEEEYNLLTKEESN